MTALPSKVADAVAHLQGGRRLLVQEFVDRDAVVTLLSIAVICQEHVLLIGPPGTAKSALLERFSKLIDDGKTFTYLLTRFTEPSELFGTLDFDEFQKGHYKLRTENMLPEASLVLLDEVFQGSSAILNSLLSVLNERWLSSGPQRIQCNLHSVLGASNELPTDPTLLAFADRFLLRAQVDYVDDAHVTDLLRVGLAHERGRTSSVVGGVTGPDLLALQDELPRVDVEPIIEPMSTIVRNLRADGIQLSDRRAVKAMKVFACAALLAGRSVASPQDLWPMAYLWSDPLDRPAIERELERADIGTAMPATDSPTKADIKYQASLLRERLSADDLRQTPVELDGILHQVHELLTLARAQFPDDTDLIRFVTAIHQEVADMRLEADPELDLTP